VAAVLRIMLAAILVAVVSLVYVARAGASPYVQFGIQDDAWLLGGPGTFDERLAQVDKLGVDLVRINVRWDAVAARKPTKATNHLDPAYDWAAPDALLLGLRRHGIAAVVTLVGTPRWANRGRAPNWAPTNRNSFANFAYATAKRYPWVRRWLIWNEPNKYWQLKPTSARTYTRMLVNPAYVQLKRANRANLVGAGVTAPRGGNGSVSPVDWIRGMRAARARFDAYAHHPYPMKRGETPTTGGCRSCKNITMADLERLLSNVQRSFGARKRIWLTEYGYQTNPPDFMLGVSPALQARYLGEAALRAYKAPRVDMLIRFLVRDEEHVGRWQSGLFTFQNEAKLAAAAFPLPIAQVGRRGAVVTLWGQVRPGDGRQTYRLRYRSGGAWRWLGGTRQTSPRGYWSLRARLPRGTAVQVFARGSLGAAIPVR
jgi:hypothetical protein